MTWVKGSSGNPLGMAVKKPFKTAMMLEILKGGSDLPRLRNIANKMIEMAEEGDVQAAKFVCEILDGKAVQVIDQTIHDRRDYASLSDDEIRLRIDELSSRNARRLAITATPMETTDE